MDDYGEYNEVKKSPIKKITLGVIAVAFIAALAMSSQIVETNDAGYIQVKQAAVSGKMSVRQEAGMYLQNFAAIHTYKISDTYDFDNEPITVRFNDAATASITGQIKFRLPINEEAVLRLHNDFRSYNAVENDLVRQVMAASLKQSATHFGAEEVYSTRRSDFIALVNDQIKVGLYATTYNEETTVDAAGNEKIKRHVRIKLDADGNKVVTETSAFAVYQIEVIQLVIQEIDFDEQTDALIAQRKNAEQQEIVAKAQAKKAKQDAIKEEEQGKAKVAKAKYQALVIKETAVIEAKKRFEVSEQNALKALEDKKAIIAKGEADAEAARLKVAAGLSPYEQAQFDKDTAIGVANALSKVKMPSVMIIGGEGGAGGTKLNPFDAVGLESFLRIAKNAAGSK